MSGFEAFRRVMGTQPRLASAAPRESRTTSIDRDVIRARQLYTIDQLIPAMMIANVICSAGLVALLYNRFPAIMFSWLGLVTVLCLWRFVDARRSLARRQEAQSRKKALRVTLQAVVSAITFVSVPSWLLSQTSGLTYTIIICQLTGTLWAGSLVLGTLVTAAIAYTTTTVGMICLGLLALGRDTEHLFLVLLFLTGSLTAIRGVLQQSRLFIASQEQQIDLQRQGDLIGLLLKDYEDQTSDWLWETDAELRLQHASERFCQAAALPVDRIEGAHLDAILDSAENEPALMSLRENFSAKQAFRDQIVPFSNNKGPQWWSLSGRPMFDGQNAFVGYRGVATDVTATKLAEARILHLAHHDALTNLPNRSLFYDHLQSCLQIASEESAAVLCLDLDGFKAVNDRYGHPAGDALLIEVSQRLRMNMPAGSTVARFGGDEFAMLVSDMRGADDVGVLCRHLTDEISKPFGISGEMVSVGMSVGVAFAPGDGTSADELLKNADSALYRAKSEGRGTFRFFELEMDRRAQERQLLVQDLRASLGKGEFILHYQPFVSSTSACITGYEALLRWRHPKRGLVPPNDFIDIAEESGLIGAIGAWVIEKACLEASTWPTDQRVSVNISPVQFRNRALPQTILAALAQCGLSPSRLEVEVTETVLIEDAEGALDILRQIRAMGVRVALDDFGTGYSSLSYLRRFPFDKIKIDRSFVQQIEAQHDSQVIVQAIVDIAKGLGMTITAEGVETLAQAEQLRRTGCEELQGFYFGRPQAPVEVDHTSTAGELTADEDPPVAKLVRKDHVA